MIIEARFKLEKETKGALRYQEIDEKGEIIEQGTHDDLLKLNGYYARLHRHQDGSYAVA